MKKTELVKGEYYATIADGTEHGNKKLYVGRFNGTMKKDWTYLCADNTSFSYTGDLCNHNFENYRYATRDEINHLHHCEAAKKYVAPPAILPELYPIF